MPAVLMVLVGMLAIAGPRGNATAADGAAVRSGAGHESAHDPGHHHCKCALRCRGAACCCGPRPTTGPSHPAASAPLAAPAESPDLGPCITAAPCRGGIPVTP